MLPRPPRMSEVFRHHEIHIFESFQGEDDIIIAQVSQPGPEGFCQWDPWISSKHQEERALSSMLVRQEVVCCCRNWANLIPFQPRTDVFCHASFQKQMESLNSTI